MLLMIHPYDQSTSSREKIIRYVLTHMRDVSSFYRILPNDDSKSVALSRIESLQVNDVLLFCGHGSNMALFGSKGRGYDASDFMSPDAIAENPELDYFDQHFIDEANCNVLSGKRIICLSCLSADFYKSFLRKKTIEFIGFRQIPASIPEIKELGIPFPKHRVVGIIKGEINHIVKRAILRGLHANVESIYPVYLYLRFATQQRIAGWSHSKSTARFQVITLLKAFLDGITYLH